VAVRNIVTHYLLWQPIPIDAGVVRRAWAVEERFRLSCWNAFIVAASQTAKCPLLLTEDLQHGQDFNGMRVIDPFATLQISPQEVLAQPSPLGPCPYWVRATALRTRSLTVRARGPPEPECVARFCVLHGADVETEAVDRLNPRSVDSILPKSLGRAPGKTIRPPLRSVMSFPSRVFDDHVDILNQIPRKPATCHVACRT
jgi:hypothetical protein